MNYQFIDEVGSGQFGDVFRAKNNKDEYVAIKIIPLIIMTTQEDLNERGYIKDVEFIQKTRFDEFKILAELKHVNIISYINSYFELDNAYLVTELWGPTLKNKIYTLEKVKLIIKQISSGLQYLHKKYIHRDLKTSNILVRNNHIKIIDFGKCVEIGRDDYKCETPISYRAPELILESSNYGPEIDIWSFGCIIYELIKNEILFYLDVNEKDDLILTKISALCGKPSPPETPTLYHLKGWDTKYSNIRSYTNLLKKHLMQLLKNINQPKLEILVDLISQTLILEPTKRITATDILKHEFLI